MVLLNLLNLRKQVENEKEQNAVESLVVVVKEKILDNDWLYFDFDVVVPFENFYIRI
jgi:hypothetical protein